MAMETETHGCNQEDHGRVSRTPLAGRARNHCSYYFLLAPLLLSGCSTLKSLGTVAAGAAGGALAGSLISGGTLAPAIGAATGGVVATGLNEMGSLNPLALASKASEVVVNKAPDNIFSVLQAATELLGWGLIGIFVLPLLLGWILPGPLAVKTKKKKK